MKATSEEAASQDYETRLLDAWEERRQAMRGEAISLSNDSVVRDIADVLTPVIKHERLMRRRPEQAKEIMERHLGLSANTLMITGDGDVIVRPDI